MTENRLQNDLVSRNNSYDTIHQAGTGKKMERLESDSWAHCHVHVFLVLAEKLRSNLKGKTAVGGLRTKDQTFSSGKCYLVRYFNRQSMLSSTIWTKMQDPLTQISQGPLIHHPRSVHRVSPRVDGRAWRFGELLRGLKPTHQISPIENCTSEKEHRAVWCFFSSQPISLSLGPSAHRI